MTKSAEKARKPKPQVTLKRRVTIRAVVTDKLKEYLKFELNESNRVSTQRKQEIQVQLSEATGAVKAQLEAELSQIDQTLAQTPAQEAAIDKLEDGSHFTQGVIEGFVGVSVGDNLYEKLGGMEILIEDGVVQKITPVGNPAI